MSYKLHSTLFLILLPLAGGMLVSSCDEKAIVKALPRAENVAMYLETAYAVGYYLYADNEKDPQGGSILKWYRADDINGKNEVLINTTIRNNIYTYSSLDAGKYLAFEVTPVQTDGIQGVPVKSRYVKYYGYDGILDDETSKDTITLYTVSEKTITKKADYSIAEGLKSLQQNTQKHEEIWQLVLKIVPENYLEKINEFMVYAGAFHRSAPLHGTSGYVRSTNEDLSTWQLGLAIDVAYRQSFDDHVEGIKGTIVHELGHIITLNDEQIDPSIVSCATYSLRGGCVKNHAYLNLFHTNYWQDIASTNTAVQNYNTNPEHFVSEYAATNIAEDIAETFRFYVLSAIPATDVPVKNKKILELNNYDPLQNLRTFIREHIGSNAIYSLKNIRKSRKFRGCGTSIMMMKR